LIKFIKVFDRIIIKILLKANKIHLLLPKLIPKKTCQKQVTLLQFCLLNSNIMGILEAVAERAGFEPAVPGKGTTP
jgi:hypothetical protein